MARAEPSGRWSWDALARSIHRWRFPILAAWGLAIAATLVAAQDVIYDPDVLVYYDPQRPARQAFDRIEERFGRTAEVVTLVVPRSGTVFEVEAVTAMARLAQRSADRPEVRAVRSALSDIGVSPRDLLAMAQEDRARVAARLAGVAEAGGEARALVAPDGSVAVVAAVVRPPADSAGTEAIAAAHRALRDAVAADAPGLQLIQTGRIVIDDAFLGESRDDVSAFAGLQVVVLAAIVLVALGSLTLTLAILVTVVAVSGGAVGVIAFLGVPLNGISSSAPAVLMGLMVASAIHVAIAWQEGIREGLSRIEATARAYRRNAKPVVLSVLTTVVSFLVLNLAEAPPFRQLGNIVAVGLLGTLVLVFTLLPALLVVVPPSEARHRARMEGWLADLGGWVVRRRRLMLGATAVVAVLAAVGIGGITIDDTFSHYFDERYEVRRATDLFEEKLSGTTIVDVAVDAGGPGEALGSSAFAAAQALTGWLEARPEVARVDSLATLGAGPDAQALRAAGERLAEAGGPRLVDEDARFQRFNVVMRGVSSRDTLAFAGAAEREAERLFGTDRAEVTGMPVLSAELSLGSARSMIVGMAIALAAISFIIVVTLRSVPLGAISLMPNLLPIAVAFGLWGFAAREVSFAATVVGALTYGIVVDDTVHILTKFQRFAELMPTGEAIREALRTVGVAVVVTTLALGLSFLPFALSGFLVNRHFGALTALTLGAALVADLLFLPALLAFVRTQRSKRRMSHPEPSQ
ncbi:efflux RND transporter permease subunit [Acuticoccus sp.]|uniref:efflux RND transporter permease subunit n=1 Tax=Acuticoccus sp. TaxID=1904378 RepID=UPI003B521CF3